MTAYDALLVLSFGGPEGPDEVIPFLEQVLRGRDVPPARLEAVAEHYQLFGGVSPINGHNRALVAAVEDDLARHGIDLPVYLGNRNWHPMLGDAVVRMRDDGIRRALVFVTSAFGSWSGCRQYQGDLVRAAAGVDGAPELHKLRLFFNHPGFVEPLAEGLQAALSAPPAEPAGATPPAEPAGAVGPIVLFSAHSVPTAMAATSPYAHQLHEAARLVNEASGSPPGELVYQSRSGPPTQPWLGPDVGERLRSAPPGSTVVVCPLGFTSDHMEVVYDLDTEAAALARTLGVRFLRTPTAGTHPRFVAMVRELIQERLDPSVPRLALGTAGPWPDACPPGCCPAPTRPLPRSGVGGPARPEHA